MTTAQINELVDRITATYGELESLAASWDTARMLLAMDEIVEISGTSFVKNILSYVNEVNEDELTWKDYIVGMVSK